MVAALILIFFSVIFWMLFEQAGSSLSLYAENSTDLAVGISDSLNDNSDNSARDGLLERARMGLRHRLHRRQPGETREE